MKKKIKMNDRACPVCSSRDETRVLAEEKIDLGALDAFAFASRKIPEYMHYRLLECPACDLLYASPLPERGKVTKSYLEAAFDSGEEARCAAITYASQLSSILGKVSGRRGALDIGAGDGAFLERLLDLGFSGVVGVEPSLAPVQNATPRVRPHLRHSLFRARDFKKESMDLVTCFQTLEHLYDPLVTCRDAYGLLRKGGVFLVVSHNRRSHSARLLGFKSPIFDIEHLQLFSPRSAKQMLERAGFSRVEVRSVFNRYPLHYWLKMLPFPRTWKETFLASLRKNVLGRLPVSLPAGNMACIGYKEG